MPPDILRRFQVEEVDEIVFGKRRVVSTRVKAFDLDGPSCFVLEPDRDPVATYSVGTYAAPNVVRHWVCLGGSPRPPRGRGPEVPTAGHPLKTTAAVAAGPLSCRWGYPRLRRKRRRQSLDAVSDVLTFVVVPLNLMSADVLDDQSHGRSGYEVLGHQGIQPKLRCNLGSYFAVPVERQSCLVVRDLKDPGILTDFVGPPTKSQRRTLPPRLRTESKRVTHGRLIVVSQPVPRPGDISFLPVDPQRLCPLLEPPDPVRPFPPSNAISKTAVLNVTPSRKIAVNRCQLLTEQSVDLRRSVAARVLCDKSPPDLVKKGTEQHLGRR